jgi:hypothetical protein
MSEPAIGLNPKATDHPPMWMGGPGDTDVLFYVTLLFLIAAVFGVGLLYLRLHALPEQLAHGESKVKLQLVGVLALLALFTHNHLFWILGLLLAIVKLPDLGTPLVSMASSLEKLAEAPPTPPTGAIGEPPAPVPAAIPTERRG